MVMILPLSPLLVLPDTYFSGESKLLPLPPPPYALVPLGLNSTRMFSLTGWDAVSEGSSTGSHWVIAGLIHLNYLELSKLFYRGCSLSVMTASIHAFAFDQTLPPQLLTLIGVVARNLFFMC